MQLYFLWNIYKVRLSSIHIVPLTPQTISICTLMKAISGNGQYIFPGDRDRTKPANSQTANMAIKRMGYKGELVSTIGKEKKFNPRLQVNSVDEYVEIMNNLDLKKPIAIDFNVASNLKLGAI